MEKKRIGLIRVLTTEDEEILASHGKIIMALYPDVEVVTRCIPDQPQGVYDEATTAAAIPKVAALAKEMARENMTAIVISCAGDPGLLETRQVVDLPVIGAGSATALLARGLGGAVGVLGITEEPPRAMAEVLGDCLLAAKRPDGVRTTLDLLQPEGRERVLQAAWELKEKGADILALACTGMSTIGIAPVIRERVGIRVVDPVSAAGFLAWYAVKE